MTDLHVTLIMLIAAAAATVFCGWRGGRPPNLARGPRLIPWRPLMAASAVLLFLLMVHLANLMGVETGRR